MPTVPSVPSRSIHYRHSQIARHAVLAVFHASALVLSGCDSPEGPSELTAELVALDSVPGRILDATSDRILYNGEPPDQSGLRIRDRRDGGDEMISPSGAELGWLAPSGAVFTPDPHGDFRDRRYFHWRAGTTTELGRAATMRVAGAYAAYPPDRFSSDDRLTLLDLSTSESEVVTLSFDLYQYDVSSHGDVVYAKGTDIFRFRDGASEQLTTDAVSGSIVNNFPHTDGTNVAYAKQRRFEGGIFRVDIMLLVPGGDETLAEGLESGVEYLANGGWTAYVDSQGHAWTRGPSGVRRQVTSFQPVGQSPQFEDLDGLEAVGPDGGLVVAHGGRRYYAPPGGAPVDIGSAESGRAVFWDATPIVIIDRTVFGINN